jgi:hypothetical protein
MSGKQIAFFAPTEFGLAANTTWLNRHVAGISFQRL